MADFDLNLSFPEDDLMRDRQRVAHEFFSSDEKYRHHIQKMLRADEHRLIVNIDEVRAFNRDFATGVLDEPNDFLPAFEAALREVVDQVADPLKNADITNKHFYIGLRGSFGDHQVTPRTLRSMHLGKMMSLEGIVTRCEYMFLLLLAGIPSHGLQALLFVQRSYAQCTIVRILSTSTIVITAMLPCMVHSLPLLQHILKTMAMVTRSSPRSASARTATTRQSLCKRCPNVPLLDSFHVLSKW